MDASQLLRRALASQQQPSYEEEQPSERSSSSVRREDLELAAMKDGLSAAVDELSISGHKHLLTKVALLRKKMREFAVAVESDDRSAPLAPTAARSEGELAEEADHERALLLSYVLDDKKKATTLNEELQRSSCDLQLADGKLRQTGHKLKVMEDLYVKEKAAGARLREELEQAQAVYAAMQGVKYQLEVASIDKASLAQQVQELLDRASDLEGELRERDRHLEDTSTLRSELRARESELELVRAERADWRKERMQLVLQGDQLRRADGLLSELNLAMAAHSKTAALQPPHVWADIPQIGQVSPQLQARIHGLLVDVQAAQAGYATVLRENVQLQSELQGLRDEFTLESEGLRNELRASKATEAAAVARAERSAQALLAAGAGEDAPFLLDRAAEHLAAFDSGAPAGDASAHARNLKVVAAVRAVLSNWLTVSPAPARKQGSGPLHLLSSSSSQSSDEHAMLRMNMMEATNLAERQNQLASVLEERLQQAMGELRARDQEVAALLAADAAARQSIARAVELRLRDGTLRFSALPSDFKQLSVQQQLGALLFDEASDRGGEEPSYAARVREVGEQLQLSRIGSPDRQPASWGSFSLDAPAISPRSSPRSLDSSALLRARASLSALREG